MLPRLSQPQPDPLLERFPSTDSAETRVSKCARAVLLVQPLTVTLGVGHRPAFRVERGVSGGSLLVPGSCCLAERAEWIPCGDIRPPADSQSLAERVR